MFQVQFKLIWIKSIYGIIYRDNAQLIKKLREN